MTTTRILLALGLLVTTARAGFAKCDPSVEPDMSDVANARVAVAAACDCASATSHGAYVKCAATTANATLVNKSCASAIKKCAGKSTCGKPTAVTCCRTNSKGKTSCSIKSTAVKCTAPKGGSACVGSFQSCCDACTTTGCATSTTSSSTTSTSVVTSTTTSTTIAGVSFAADVQPIYTIHCAFAGCHAGASPAAGMNLSSGQAYANTVSVSSVECGAFFRIAPGAPGSSYLLFKVMGSGPCFVGSMMPLVGTPLTAGEIQTISDWVTQGALNN